MCTSFSQKAEFFQFLNEFCFIIDGVNFKIVFIINKSEKEAEKC